MQAVDVDSRVARLEKENHNLMARLQKLEKQRRSSIPVFLAQVLLLVCAGLLADYLGFFGLLADSLGFSHSRVERLPLLASRVEAQEFVLQARDGETRARLTVTNDGFRLVDDQGKPIYSKP